MHLVTKANLIPIKHKLPVHNLIKKKSRYITLNYISKIFRHTHKDLWKKYNLTHTKFTLINKVYYQLLVEDLVKHADIKWLGEGLGSIFLKGTKVKVNSKYLFKDYGESTKHKKPIYRDNNHSGGLCYILKWDRGIVANSKYYHIQPVHNFKYKIYDSVQDDTINTL